MPLAYWFMNVTSIEKVVSANAVSVMGVCLAAVAARMFLSDSVRVRQIGVVLFKARDFMDSLDGFVARARKKEVNKAGAGGRHANILLDQCSRASKGEC